MSESAREMPKYRCHKEVRALKIKEVWITDRAARLAFEEPGYAPVEVPREWYWKHSPVPGGYYVTYEDGYTSYSPAKAFEDGYTRIS